MNLEDEKEFYNIIKKVLNSKEFNKRKEYQHHGNTSVYEHSINVSKTAYILCKKMHLNYKDAAIAGILHDFYLDPWKEVIDKKPLFKKHGFVHAREALENSRKYFPKLLNDRIENAILRHMFPLNIIPPKHIISWVVTISDKYVAMNDIRFEIPLYKLKKVLVNE